MGKRGDAIIEEPSSEMARAHIEKISRRIQTFPNEEEYA